VGVAEPSGGQWCGWLFLRFCCPKVNEREWNRWRRARGWSAPRYPIGDYADCCYNQQLSPLAGRDGDAVPAHVPKRP